DVGRDPGQALLQIPEAAGAGPENAHHHERPAGAADLERPGPGGGPAPERGGGRGIMRGRGGLQKNKATIFCKSLAPPRGPPAPPLPRPAPLAARTRAMLDGAIAPTLVRLAAPTVLVMTMQAAITTLDGYFIGWLGPEALAGVSLVFPLVMLMQTMSAGGMGGGVASAVARALGARRREDADALVSHALVIAVGMAALFMAGALSAGPALYRAMGGDGATL